MRISIGLMNVLALVFLTTACVSNKTLWMDDVYHMRQAELPEGESLADETGYANFKERMESLLENSNYQTDQDVQNYGYYDSYHSFNSLFWGISSLNYYPSTTLFFGQGIPGFNQDLSWYGSYGYPYYSSYFNYDPLFSVYGYNPYYNYGNFNQGYGFFNDGLSLNFNSGNYFSNNQNGNNSGNSGYGNYHEGPRGSLAGYSNSANRLSVSTIKTSEPSTNYNAPNRPTVIGNFIISEEENNTINNVNSIRKVTYTDNNRMNKADYTPKEQRIQQFNTSMDYNYSSFGSNSRDTYNNSGINVTRSAGRDVPIHSTPSRTNTIQPARGTGVTRQATPGRRN